MSIIDHCHGNNFLWKKIESKGLATSRIFCIAKGKGDERLGEYQRHDRVNEHAEVNYWKSENLI